MSHEEDDAKALARAILAQVLEATMNAWRLAVPFTIYRADIAQPKGI